MSQFDFSTYVKQADEQPNPAALNKSARYNYVPFQSVHNMWNDAATFVPATAAAGALAGMPLGVLYGALTGRKGDRWGAIGRGAVGGGLAGAATGAGAVLGILPNVGVGEDHKQWGARIGTGLGGAAGLYAASMLKPKEEPKTAVDRERKVTRFGEGPKTVSFSASKKPPVKGFFNSLSAHMKGPEKEEKKEEPKTASALEFGKAAARGDMAKKTLGRSVQAPKRGRQRAGELAGRLNQARNDNKGSASYAKKIEALQGSMRRQPPESLTALANGLSMWVDRSPAGLASYAKDVQLGQQQSHQKFLDYTGGLRPSNFDAMPAPTFTTPGEKIGSALAFGAMLKRSFDFNNISSGIQTGLNNAYEGAKNIYNSKGVQNFVNDPTTRAGLTYGAVGAGLGGLYGAINPGEYEDADGQVRRRGRFMGALRGAGAGGAALGLAGAGAQEGRYQYLKNMLGNDTAGNQANYPNGLPSDRAGMQQAVEGFAEQNAPSMQYSPLESAYEGYNKFVNPAMQNAQRLYKHLRGSSATTDTNDGELILPDPNAR